MTGMTPDTQSWSLDPPLSEEAQARQAEPILSAHEIALEQAAMRLSAVTTMADAIAALKATERDGEDAQLIEQMRLFLGVAR
jgi:hypothetical protein